MRFLGVLVIIYAHTHPPEWIDQIRNFGTPLLIVASAATYAYIYRFRVLDVPKFLKKRVYRLLVPLWIFLTFFFGSIALAALLFDRPYPFETEEVLESYVLYHGIGYVWIFKVYLYLAFLTPPLLAFSRHLRSNVQYYGILIAVLLVYSGLCLHYENSMSEYDFAIFSEYVLTIFPYAVLYCYGLRLHTLKKKTILTVALVSGLICALMAGYLYRTTGQWVPTQEYKYPPQLYYLSYAFMWVNLIYVFAYTKVVKNIPSRVMRWLSENSLWIYLWHIAAVYGWDKVIAHDGTFTTSFLKFWLFLFTAVTIVLLQNEVTQRVPTLRFILNGDRKVKKVA
jgi:peptidoglycan/LPS O-acetylase OafA/YrhL